LGLELASNKEIVLGIFTTVLAYIKPFILPPGLHIFSLIFSTIIMLLRRKLGFLLLIISLSFYYICATPIFSNWLISSLETYPPLDITRVTADNNQTTKPDIQAIVVLSGGRNNNSPEYNGETVSGSSLIRLRYAAKLSKATNLPVIVSGGNPLEKSKTSDAELMKAALVNDFGVNSDNVWVEPNSDNTYENAEFTKAILVNKNLKNIYCVTSAYHMPRAMLSFEKVGVNAIAAPTDYLQNDISSAASNAGILTWLPSIHSYAKSRTALHEFFGLVWYKTK
jgi:uncharacterized SAM-binding protein YcdF (DUF218 family)